MNKTRLLQTYGYGAFGAFIFVLILREASEAIIYTFNDFIVDVFFGSIFAYSLGTLLEVRFKIQDLKNLLSNKK